LFLNIFSLLSAELANIRNAYFLGANSDLPCFQADLPATMLLSLPPAFAVRMLP
jgi:hypothetical protein